MQRFTIWIGFDPREHDAYAVARTSIARQLPRVPPVSIRPVVLRHLVEQGVYTRPTTWRNGRIYDELSKRPGYDGEMSTEFALSRFLVPHLAKSGWALFVDCDVMARAPLTPLEALIESVEAKDKALYCVQHDYTPKGATKMDGRQQTAYFRKMWSSVMLFNCDHPANKGLTPELINAVPGRDLHRFVWLDDSEIGELDPRWNFLVGHHTVEQVPNPAIVHFTTGVPTMPGHDQDDFADEWLEARAASAP